MISKILIANRGEIACRVIKTAKKLGIKTVAVYSDADVDSLHVKHADEAFHIGKAPSRESYLVAERILQVAKDANCDAIHPGYGFLSENADFAAQCAQQNIEFIGPPSLAIEEMGSKSRSKELMASANVPLVPGYYGENQDPEFLRSEAAKVGYPVLVKAAFGGGGKGMRIVRNDADFITELDGAKREALAGFGNDKVLIERYIDTPRHVEVQVFADKQGNCIYLGDRDCSLQRRHQKVIEEAPAPGLSEHLRKEMGEAAVRCAKAINYVGAGTVEFLLCGDEFFFMEMNTRLQVEHPVTEMVTGQDLVHWQILVASGEPLPLLQEQVTLTGHALEARVYAETPHENFMPCAGVVTHFDVSADEQAVRIDTGITSGSEISAFYDPMIAKIIVHGDNRKNALLQLASSLEQSFISGLDTNITFLHQLATHKEFVESQPSTHFIDENIEQLIAYNQVDSIESLLFASAIYLDSLRCKQTASPWQNTLGFKLNLLRKIIIPFMEHDIYAVANDTGFTLSLDGVSHELIANISDNHIVAYIDGRKLCAKFSFADNTISVMFGAAMRTYQIKSKHYIAEKQDTDNTLAAPLNGTVVKHLLPANTEVKAGDGVIIIEAMKMEYTLTAPFDGVLAQYYFDEGELVSHGDLLAHVKELEA